MKMGNMILLKALIKDKCIIEKTFWRNI